VKIVELTPALEPVWDRFATSAAHAMLYYGLGWRDLLARLLGCRPRYLMAMDGETPAGILPLMQADGPYGTVLNSLPYYGSNGGVLAADETARAALWQAYVDATGAADVAAATVIAHPLRPDAPPDASYQFTDDRIGQWTALGSTVPPLWDRIDGTARRNIRKAEKSGIRVSVDNSAFDFLYDTHHDNITAIGGLAKDYRMFALVAECFAGDRDYRLYVAHAGDTPVAALLLFYHGDIVEYFTPATVHDARELQPSAALLMAAMTAAGDAGYRWWNWGGTWLSQQGVYRFKRKWGAEDRPYRYYIRLNEPAMRDARRTDLLSAYPGFFTLPFGVLTPAE
jgi:CelD/BcsL family acetyltransferase involved in cellulose biosynthesis